MYIYAVNREEQRQQVLTQHKQGTTKMRRTKISYHILQPTRCGEAFMSIEKMPNLEIFVNIYILSTYSSLYSIKVVLGLIVLFR